ncbi:ribbon-helix-helix protein, CopG family [Halopolyspora algeriensis]|nr:ribbon-helix-helix protein, CopG family [Halopolyspora algeriensis]
MSTRTTITIDEDLLDELKMRAAAEHTTVSALIEQDVRFAQLRRSETATREAPRFALPTFDLGEPKPGVDLTNNAALLEFLEGEE